MTFVNETGVQDMLASKYGVENGRVEMVFISADVDCAHHL